MNLNIIQEIFLVLYTILFGSMLQSLGGLQPFPWGRIFSEERFQCIFEDEVVTTTVGRIARCRLALSLWLLNVCPIFFFLVTLCNLGGFNYTNYLYSFPDNFCPLVYMVWNSLSVFGFYRLYTFLTIWSTTRWIFCDRWRDIQKRKIYRSTWGHIVGVLLYLLPPIGISHFVLGFDVVKSLTSLLPLGLFVIVIAFSIIRSDT